MHPMRLPETVSCFRARRPRSAPGPYGETRWVLDGVLCHSNEFHSDGGFWIEAFLVPQFIERVSKTFKEDAIVHVSEDDEILYQKSVPELLIENGLAQQVYGQDFYPDDPTHMNDVQETISNNKY